MVWLKHINDEEGADYSPEEIPKLLNSGYAFTDPRVNVLVSGEDGSDVAHSLDPETAKKYIAGGQGSYMDKAALDAYKREGGWTEGIVGGAAAVGLGVADALSFGAATPLAGQMGLDTEGITDEWGGTKLTSDLITTGLAVYLSGGLGAPLAGGGKAAQILSKLGLSKLGKAATKAPWKYTAPAVSDKVGRLVTDKIASKLLKGVAADTIEQAGARGLLARVGGFSVEGLMYGAGYGTVDAAIGLYNGRDPEDVAGTFLTELGTGALLGAVIPTVFYGTGLAAMKSLRGAVGFGKKAINWSANTKIAESYNRHVMARAKDANPREYLKASRGMDLAEQRQRAHLVDETHEGIRELAKRQDDIIENVSGQHLDEVKGIQSAFDEFDQAGHSDQFIMKAFDELSFGDEGAASSVVLLDTLLEGMDKYGRNTGSPLMGTGPEAARRSSEGLLDVLQNIVEGFIVTGTATKGTKAGLAMRGRALEVSKEIKPQAHKELNNILETIKALRKKAESKVDEFSERIIKNDPDLEYPGTEYRKDFKWKWRNDIPDWGKIEYYSSDLGRQLSHVGAGPKSWREKLLSIWGDENAKQILDKTFNKEIFQELEYLSSRLHRGIKEGPFPDQEPYQELINLFKGELTPFLTNEGAWNIIPHGSNMSTPFGKMANYKNEINTLMVQREGHHQQVREFFFEEDPRFKDNWRPSKDKLEDWIMTLDHHSSQTKLEWLENYSTSTRGLMELLDQRYKVPKAPSKPGTKGRKAYWDVIEGREKWLEKSMTAEKGVKDFSKFLRTEMTPALNYAALIQRESALARATDSPSLYLPKAMGLGIGGALGAMGGFPLMGAAAGIGVGAFKGFQDTMINPAGSLAKLHLFFSAVNGMEAFVNEQVERYFKWLNYHKDFDMFSKAEFAADEAAIKKKMGAEFFDQLDSRKNRLEYKGPGTDLRRFPRIYTSNAIARLVTGDNAKFPEKDDDPEETLGSKFGPKHAERAHAIAKALSNPDVKETLLDEAVKPFGFDPNLQQELRKQSSEALDAAKKEISKLGIPEKGMFDDPSAPHTVSNSVAQTSGESLAVIEYSTGAILKGIMDGTLTANEADTAWRLFPQQMTKLAALFQTKLSDPRIRAGIPKKEIDLMKLIMRVDSDDNGVAFAMQETYRKEEEEKPGPKPHPKWTGDTSQIAQLSGSYGILQRRIT